MDWRYAQYRNAFPEDDEQARSMLARAFAEFPYWPQLASMLADVACERMDEAERKAMWHAHFGREKERGDAFRFMPFYEAVHRLAHLIRHVDMVSSARDVVEAVVARHARPGSKHNPIEVGPKPPKKRQKG